MHFIKCSMVILAVVLCPLFGSAEVIEGTVESTDGAPISYRVQGEGDPALVFVHGWLANQGFWDAQREFFAQTHKVVTLDLAGHGTSGQDRQTWSIEAFGDDVVAVLSALKIEKAILIGHAMGGSVALDAASKLPEKVIGIIGVDALQDFELVPTPEQQEQILAKLQENYADLRTRSIQSMLSREADPVLVEKITTDMSSVPEEIGIATMQASLAYKLIPVVQSLSAPIRCINSDAVPPKIQENQQYARSYEIMLVPGSKHLFFLESPDEFNSILANVLQEIVTYNANEAEAKLAE